MIAEVLAGISLVKASVDFIKSNVNTAKDIGEIAGAIDDLFKGNDELQKQRSKKSSVGMGDQFGIKSVAQEVIDAKLAEEKLNEMRNLIDFRFGPGTWVGIVNERAKRIQEAKEAEKLARIEKRKQDDEYWEMIKNIIIVGGVIIFAIIALVVVLYKSSV